MSIALAESTVTRDRALFTRSLDRDHRQLATDQLHALGRDTSRDSVRQFQREQGIKVDGIIGPETSATLARATAERERSGVDRSFRVAGVAKAPTEAERVSVPAGSTPARDLIARDEARRNAARTVAPSAPPPNASERERFDHYASIVRANGGQVNPNGQATVLGVRARDGVTKKFEDKVVVLTADGRVREFEGSTRPAQTTRRNGGVAELKPGNYDVRPHGPHYGRPSWQVFTQNGSGNVPAYRDLNGDGQYSAAEKARAHTASGILFHVPNPAYGDRTPTSIGCINIRNRDWNAFMSAVGGAGRRFNFTLVDR